MSVGNIRVGFFKFLGDVATILLDLVCLIFFLFLHVIPDGLDDGENRAAFPETFLKVLYVGLTPSG